MARAELMRKVYRRYFTPGGRFAQDFEDAADFDEEMLEKCAADRDNRMTLLIPHDQYPLLGRIHAGATVLSSKAEDAGTRVEAIIPDRLRTLCLPWAVPERV